MANRWRIPTATRSNDPRFTNRNNNHAAHYGKGLCKVCGQPVGRGHDWGKCSDRWIEQQDRELKERAGTP